MRVYCADGTRLACCRAARWLWSRCGDEQHRRARRRRQRRRDRRCDPTGLDEVDLADVEPHAEPAELSVRPHPGAAGDVGHRISHTITGGCTAPTDWHIFSLWPHMHTIATHQTFTVLHNNVPTTMLDQPYSFMEQKNYPMPDTVIHAGDSFHTACTYLNNTGATVQ